MSPPFTQLLLGLIWGGVLFFFIEDPMDNPCEIMMTLVVSIIAVLLSHWLVIKLIDR